MTAPWPRSLGSPQWLAIAWMLIAGTCFVAMSGFIKSISTELPTATLVFLRHAFALLMLAPWLAVRARRLLPRERITMHLARAVIGTASLFCFVYALQELNLAYAVTISYTTPLWTVLLSILFLKERIGWRRALATGAGFAGVLIILRPQADIDVAALVALGSAILSGITFVIVKRLSSADSPTVMTAYFTIFGTIVSTPLLLLASTMPSTSQALTMAAASGLGLIGVFSVAHAYSLAPASVVAPVDFCRLPIAAIMGYVLFAELPDLGTVAGATIIIGATLYIGFRERRLALTSAGDTGSERLRSKGAAE